MLALSRASALTSVRLCDLVAVQTFAERLDWALAWRLQRARARNELGPGGKALSQNDVERTAGLRPGHLSTLRRGRRKNPAGETARKVARALECDVAWLLGATEEPYPGRNVDEMFPGEPERGLARELPLELATRQRVVESRDRYPNRERMIELHKYVWPLALVEALRAVKLKADDDQSERAWVEEAEAIWARMRGKAGAPLVDLSEGPAPDMSFLVRSEKKAPPTPKESKARRRDKPRSDRNEG